MERESKRIVLLEFIDEAKAFLTYCEEYSNAPELYCIIALHYEVQVYLKQRNVKYENTLEYFSNQHHKRALLKSEEWYQYLAERVNISDGKGLKYTYNNSILFYFRFYIHHFLFCVEVLRSIYQKYDIDSISACKVTKLPCDGNPLITENERYVWQIAKLFAENKGIKFTEIPMIFKAVNANLRPSLGWFVLSALHKIYRFLLFNRIKGNNVLLTTTVGYNVGNLLSKLKEELSSCYCVELRAFNKNLSFVLLYNIFRLLTFNKKGTILSLPLFSKQAYSKRDDNTVFLEKSFSIMTENLQKEWYETFIYENINFIDIFLDKIKHSLKTSLLVLGRESEEFSFVLRKLNVKLLLSPYSRHTSALFGELCQLSGIPTFMIGHGMIPKPKNEFECIENFHLAESLILSKVYVNVALQTPNEELGFNFFSSNQHAIKTGPLILSKTDLLRKSEFIRKIVPELRSGTRIILYPENTRERFTLRFQVFETFDEFLASVIDLVNAIKDMEAVHLVIRLHPGKKISPEEFVSLLPPSNNLTVTSAEMPFYQVLSISDLLINFSSTVIEDALQNRIPVLLYDRRNRCQHYQAQHLTSKKAKKVSGVYYVNDSEDLKDGIEWIVNKHLNNDIPNSLFDNYTYSEDYFKNVKQFIKGKLIP